LATSNRCHIKRVPGTSNFQLSPLDPEKSGAVEAAVVVSAEELRELGLDFRLLRSVHLKAGTAGTGSGEIDKELFLVKVRI
jgi:hypothetical protein